MKRSVFLCLALALVLTGCGSWPARDPTVTDPDPRADLSGAERRFDEAEQRIKAARQQAATDDPLSRLAEVRIPLHEEWLEQRLEARYPGLGAEEAIRAVLQGRPTRFDFDPLASSVGVTQVARAQTLRDHLDAIAVQTNWHWQVDGGVVVWRDLVTRTFSLSSQPGAVAAGLGLRNLNETGGSTADNAMRLALDPYANEIIPAVENVLGLGAGDRPDGAGGVDPRTAVTLAPSGNLLIVTARPRAMQRVEQWLAAYNDAVRRTVRISLSLIEVDFRDGRSRELALNLIRRSSRFPLSLLLGASTASLDDEGQVTGGTLSGRGGAALGGHYARDGAREHGSTAVLQWLDTFGDTTLSYDDTIEVRSNQIASVDLTRTEQYVASITRTPVEGSNQLATEIEFDELRTGLVIHLQPTVLRGSNEITLRLGLSRSSLVDRQPYTFGEVAGETHITDDFNRLLSIALQDGEPRLLASLSEVAGRDERARIPLLGRFGLNTAKAQREREREMVLMITATVVER